jgi:hypothetical protein
MSRVDNVNCINLWAQGESSLGRSLDKATYLPFTHNKLGLLCSIDGVWNFLQSADHDDRLRYLTGYRLVQLARKLKRGSCVNFRAAILDSTYQKILAHPKIKNAVIENELPYDCWFVDKRTSVKQRPVKYVFWYLPGIEEVTKAIKEDRVPDLTRWMRDKSVGIYDDVLDRITVKPIKHSEDTDYELASTLRELAVNYVLNAVDDKLGVQAEMVFSDQAVDEGEHTPVPLDNSEPSPV